MTQKPCLLAPLLLTLAILPSSLLAADHRDGSALLADPATDINDVYAWMSPDRSRVYLAMTVFPAASAGSKFSSGAHYVFHTASRKSFLDTAQTPLDIICSFDEAQRIQCWAGADRANYVAGDTRAPNVLTSRNRRLRVFAGLRDDPFFFNLDGFNAVRQAVKTAAPDLVSGGKFDASGCPALDTATAAVLVKQLRERQGGGPPTDFFARLGTLAIVLDVDRTLLDQGGPILSVWGGTHRKK